MVERNKEVSGLTAIGVGEAAIIAKYERLARSENRGNAEFRCEIQADIVFIHITKEAVFDDLKKFKGKRKIEFVRSPESFLTILGELTASEIYLRIKNFYCDILDNYLGKTTSEQQDYVFRFNKPISMIPWSPGHIEQSEKYIRSLSESPTPAELESLVTAIISKILEYAYYAKDEYGVEMHQYAKALEKKLK